MPASTKIKYRRKTKSAVIVIAAVLLVFYILAPQIKYFNNSIATVKSADFGLVGVALLFIAASYFAAAATYCFIAYFKLKYWRTVLIQIADSFTNRLLPAGAGGVATNFIYLNRHRQGRLKAGLVVGLNNFIGILGHGCLLLGLLLVNSITGGQTFHLRLPQSWWLVVVGVAIITPLLLFVRLYLPRLAAKNLTLAADMLKFVLHHPKRMLAALASSMSLTICYSLALYMVMLSLNVHLSFLQTFLVLTVGVVAIAVTPTPGGIGGVEAGLAASLISFGVAPQQALSVALVYRVITYWLPLVPGVIGLRIALRRSYLVA